MVVSSKGSRDFDLTNTTNHPQQSKKEEGRKTGAAACSLGSKRERGKGKIQEDDLIQGYP